MTTEAAEEVPQVVASESSVPSKPAPSPNSKPCTLCGKLCDVRVRCQIDALGKWELVCPGKCWKSVSGGKIDGDKDHPYYRYGGMWKNKKDAVSAKKKKKKSKAIQETQEQDQDQEETHSNDGEHQDEPEQATTSDEELLTKEQ